MEDVERLIGRKDGEGRKGRDEERYVLILIARCAPAARAGRWRPPRPEFGGSNLCAVWHMPVAQRDEVSDGCGAGSELEFAVPGPVSLC